VDRASLDAAVSDYGWEVQSYEVQPGRVVFNLWLHAGGTTFSFTMKPCFAMSATSAESILYDYCNPEARAYSPRTLCRSLNEFHLNCAMSPPLRYSSPCSARRSSITSSIPAMPANFLMPIPGSRSAIPCAAMFFNSLQPSTIARSAKCAFSAVVAPPPSPALHFSVNPFRAGNCASSTPSRPNPSPPPLAVFLPPPSTQHTSPSTPSKPSCKLLPNRILRELRVLVSANSVRTLFCCSPHPASPLAK